jgi:hypothetical protein
MSDSQMVRDLLTTDAALLSNFTFFLGGNLMATTTHTSFLAHFRGGGIANHTVWEAALVWINPRPCLKRTVALEATDTWISQSAIFAIVRWSH